MLADDNILALAARPEPQLHKQVTGSTECVPQHGCNCARDCVIYYKGQNAFLHATLGMSSAHLKTW